MPIPSSKISQFWTHRTQVDKASEDGHCYLPESQIIHLTKELLTTEEHQAEEQALANILSEMVTEQQLIKERDQEVLYYKPTFYHFVKGSISCLL